MDIVDENDTGFPKHDDPNLQYKLYIKREFYVNKVPERPEYSTYEDIEKIRKNICRPNVLKQRPHQIMLPNYINSYTPIKGALIFHKVGSGKCVHPSTLININNILLQIIEIWNLYATDIQYKDNMEISKIKNLCTMSYNKGNLEIEAVDYIYREYVKTNLQKITLKNGSILIKTYSHKILIDNKWISNPNINDKVYFLKNEKIINIEIINIEDIEYDGYVYDLEVRHFHNYIANNIITHNTCVGISVAEGFMPLIEKYKTKIHILVPGPTIKETWKNDIINQACTGNKYYDFQNINNTEEDKKLSQMKAITKAMNFYKIMGYKSFYKKVLGDKIIDKKVLKNNMIKTEYRKTKVGEYEREFHTSRITELNNTLLIVDEAHNLLGSNIGEALEYIIRHSVNLKILLLTATPMANSAEDIVKLLNFLRPINQPILKDKIFTNTQKVDELEIKQDGLEYLKNMSSGYVSYIRGGDPLTYAKQIDMGNIPSYLLFTKVSSCIMSDFQLQTYNSIINEELIDGLSKKSSDVSNFVYPILNDSHDKIIGVSGKSGIKELLNQLINYEKKLNELICKQILKLDKPINNFIQINSMTKSITGSIYKKEYLQIFSTKFYKALCDIEDTLFINKTNKLSKTGFVYCNMVKNGIDIFQEVLFQNGYLEFKNDGIYDVRDDTICYKCNNNYKDHDNTHTFHPAIFLKIIGKVSDDDVDTVNDNNINYIKNVFNDISNMDGKKIKLILGSKVINEGVTLKNVGSVQIIDVHYHFGRVEQVVGRAIRWCVHYDVMSIDNIFPEVKVFKYAIKLEDGRLSSDEELYKKAEKKFLLIKKIEKVLKENAIDCALNYNANVFPEEIEKYKNCSATDKNNLCPEICEFTNCKYICNDQLLIAKYYDKDKKIFKKIDKKNLDYSTFTLELSKNEINYAKNKIKEMYILNYIYDLKTITDYIFNSIDDLEKKELFDNFFIYKALDDLIPITQNDFNNFIDIIYDKNNRQGYLIYIDKYYIYQPFDKNENIPIHARITSQFNYINKFNLTTFLKLENIIEDKLKSEIYDFESVFEYYDNREDNFIVGALDQQPDKINKSNYIENFKIRDYMDKKQLNSNRESGTQTFRGAVCNNSKSKKELKEICKKLKLTNYLKVSRNKICILIMDKLIELEKYSVGKDKKNYILIPSNHPKYNFPLNLEDRVEYVKNQIIKLLNVDTIPFKITNKNNTSYTVIFEYNIHEKLKNEIKKIGWIEDNEKYKIIID